MDQQPPTTDALRFVDEFLVALLARASHAVSGEFHDRLRLRGVGVPEWRVLAALQGSPGETVTSLASACLLQQPTMTKVLDRMERSGLVRRQQDSADRRLVRIVLTPRGDAMASDLLAAARLHEAEIIARYPEAQEIKGLLRALIARQGAQHRTR